ncbi:beta-ketoacyl synthase [Streptomyces sp. SID8354]|nr:beta-ketoacyl synthase [Streptomyces sp. SID8354]
MITGWSVLSSAGPDRAAFTEAVARYRAQGPSALPAGVGAVLYDDPLPGPAQHVVPDFDVRAALGRKGTGSYDRNTGLAVVACGQALADSGIDVAAVGNRTVGAALGTTVGSLRSTSDYSLETLTQPRPYLVNPALFPNTVMNCAAGQAAIRYGLRGVNATVAGGTLGFHGALRYALNALRRGAVRSMLTGAVEEFTPHSAWACHHIAGAAPPGEAAAVFLIEHPGNTAGGPPRAEILAACSATALTPQDTERALARCVSSALDRAGIATEEVRLVVTGDGQGPGGVQDRAARTALGDGPEVLDILGLTGDCQAANGALQLATLLAVQEAGTEPAAALGVVTGCTPDGAVGAMVVRGCGHGGADRR